MDRLTAIRSFAKPGFTPAKRVRIRNDRWYLVRFQNVETNPLIDYVGLADGEYTQLLPGHKAREARDAHLNHCNAIQEYSGPIFAVQTTQYGNTDHNVRFFPTEQDALAEVERKRAQHEKWIADCEQEAIRYRAIQETKPESWRARSIADCERVIRDYRDKFAFEIKNCTACYPSPKRKDR